MPTFKDNLGREWTIEITGIEVKMLRKEMQLDILSALDKESDFLKRLSDDPVLLVDCISLLLTEQIKTKGLNERQFALGLVGNGLQMAIDCLVEAIVLFSPPRQGAVLRTIWSELTKMDEAASQKAIQVTPKLVAKAFREMDSALEKLSD